LGSESAIGATSASPQKVFTAADPGKSDATGEGPSTPAPSPEPGGASGGSAAGASSAGASSASTLTVVLQIGPQRAVRRLRLASEPWLTTCFVLIPERPD